MTALELKDLTFSYPNTEDPTLQDISFAAEYGEVTLLAGDSGSGKSTLLRLLSGIIPNSVPGEIRGEILVDGESAKGWRIGKFCRKVGVVLQNAEEQILQQSVADEIAFGCENLNLPEEEIGERIEKVCTMMDLDPAQKPRTLSGGQKQSLMTACILAMGQRILLLDEPLANLDQAGALKLMNLCKKLAHEEGYAVLLVEHRIDVVLPYADCLWELKDRTVQKVEDPDTFLAERAAQIPDHTPRIRTGRSAFDIRDLYVSPGKRDVITGLNTEIFEGERIVLLGENGCGKTTFLRSIARLQKTKRGDIIQNVDPKIGGRASKKWFKTVGVVEQNPDYQLFMPSVERELLFGGRDPEKAEEVLEQFHFTELRDRHPHSLSEGQKRLLTIMAVLAGEPKVLLLDEPTVGQDREALSKLVGTLNRVHEETKNTMITITHDARCAMALCDRALWIRDGKVYKTGRKELVAEYFSESSRVI